MTNSWGEWVEQLVGCDDDEVADVEDGFARAVNGSLQRMAAKVVRDHRLPAEQFNADALSLVSTEFVAMMRQARASRLDGVERFSGVLYVRLVRSFRAFLHTECGINPASGMNGLRRRKDAIYQTRMEILAATGTEPGTQELLDATNKAMLERRANAVKQGMIVSEADLAPIESSVSFDPVTMGAATSAHTPAPIEAVERKELARLVMDHPDVQADRLASQVARFFWLPQLDDNPTAPVTLADVRRQFPAYPSAELSRVFVLAVRTVPKKILADRFGIEGLTG